VHLLVGWIRAPLCRLLYRPVVQGADGVPRRGPVILPRTTGRPSTPPRSRSRRAGRCRSWARPSTSPVTGCARARRRPPPSVVVQRALRARG